MLWVDFMDEDEFERLLAICRIKLDDSEKHSLKKDIESVLDYFDILESVSSQGSVAYQPIDVEGIMRDDSVEIFKNISGILRNARTFRFYVVGPRV